MDPIFRILGETRLAEVEEAFSGHHPGNPKYSWRATAKIHGETVAIEGLIFFNQTDVGRFSRRLYFQSNRPRAYHEILELTDEHQSRGIAREHYTKVIRFYDSLRVRFIELSAESTGVIIWPQLGFDLSHAPHRQRLMRILREWDVEPLPDPESVLAPIVVDIGTTEEPTLGEEALYELADRVGEGLPMVLDLDHPLQRAFLENRGILAARVSNDDS